MTSSEAETEEEDGCQQKISKKNKNENDVKPTLRYIPEVGNINFFCWYFIISISWPKKWYTINYHVNIISKKVIYDSYDAIISFPRFLTQRIFRFHD
jgi:hypothetical protein